MPVLALVAVLFEWLSGAWWLRAVAIAGFGVGILYPRAAALTLAAAPEAPAAASARLVLAAGLAILVAPLLGVIAGLTDITAAWLLVSAVALLSVPVDRARQARATRLAALGQRR